MLLTANLWQLIEAEVVEKIGERVILEHLIFRAEFEKLTLDRVHQVKHLCRYEPESALGLIEGEVVCVEILREILEAHIDGLGAAGARVL